MAEDNEPTPEEIRDMRALYDAEKASGILVPQDDLEAALIDAGRSHLVKHYREGLKPPRR